MAQGAFQGVKVIEFGHFLLVPMATAILADLGADVIKIENPKGGEPARFPIPVENVAPPADFPYLWFHEFNRGKRDIALDVNKEQGREVLYRLVEGADVFATNFDPRFDQIRFFHPDWTYQLVVLHPLDENTAIGRNQ